MRKDLIVTAIFGAAAAMRVSVVEDTAHPSFLKDVAPIPAYMAPMTELADSTVFWGQLFVGTPLQGDGTTRFAYDTRTAQVAIPATTCTEGCNSAMYDYSKSSTATYDAAAPDVDPPVDPPVDPSKPDVDPPVDPSTPDVDPPAPSDPSDEPTDPAKANNPALLGAGTTAPAVVTGTDGDEWYAITDTICLHAGPNGAEPQDKACVSGFEFKDLLKVITVDNK